MNIAVSSRSGPGKSRLPVQGSGQTGRGSRQTCRTSPKHVEDQDQHVEDQEGDVEGQVKLVEESVLGEVVEPHLLVPLGAVVSSLLYCPAPRICRIAVRMSDAGSSPV